MIQYARSRYYYDNVYFSHFSNVTSLRKSNLVVKLSIDKAEPMYHSLFSRYSNVTSLRKSNLVVKLSIDKAEKEELFKSGGTRKRSVSFLAQI